jgi:uncharacterized membrane protein HdeD (DUF308 family)
MQEGARTIYAIGRQVIYTAIGLALGIAALQLHFRGEDALARWLAYGAAACGVLLIVSSILARPKKS